MTQAPLLYVPGATEGTTQWRAESLQLVNWGGFHGHAQIQISPTTTLLSGASGTGKSTLLDAYLALMMKSDTPFNGASNDAATGRARSAEQRNLLTYLRGKLDSNRETGTDELVDQVLRGHRVVTWGAIAMTFVDDNQRRVTALRAYHVPAGANAAREVTMKMAVVDSYLNLRALEPLAAGRFEKRALETAFAGLKVYDTYDAFAQVLFTRLGIGAGGDGAKALRLLARIQAGHQVRSVDSLYKSLVLEEPATYKAADKAVAHFTDLDAAYEAMLTEAEKVKVLAKIPDLHRELTASRETELLIDTFGLHRTDIDTPWQLWQLTTEAALLEVATDSNRADRREVAQELRSAEAAERELSARLSDVVEQQREAGGPLLDRLKLQIEELGALCQATEQRRRVFDSRTAVLGLDVNTAAEYAEAHKQAEQLLAEFPDRDTQLEQQRRAVQDAGYPLRVESDELKKELESLRTRKGLVPRAMDEARRATASAAGIDPEQLPFVAELIDIADGQDRWRSAAEVTLASIARVMLVDAAKEWQLRRAIEPLRITPRIHFEAVPQSQFLERQTNSAMLSGKLAYKDSPFGNWVQERLRRTGVDWMCVDSVEDLGGAGRRVTVTGQTRDGSRGAHGHSNVPPIIGFDNTARITEMAARVVNIEGQVLGLAKQEAELRRRSDALRVDKDAAQYLVDTEWQSIDVAAVEASIAQREVERDRILSASDNLRALNVEAERLDKEREEQAGRKHRAKQRAEELDATHLALCERQDAVDDELVRIDRAGLVRLAPEQTERLESTFAEVTNPDDLSRFQEGVGRLRNRLSTQSQAAREQSSKLTDQLVRVFETYQRSWNDPNLGTDIESYGGYRDILDNITRTGLHERQQEWRRRLFEWSGQDLVPLNAAFDTAITDIEERLEPVNAILAGLPFGPARDRLKISLRRLHPEDVQKFRRDLRALSSGVTAQMTDEAIEARFKRLRAFISQIRREDAAGKTNTSRDLYLDVRKHVEITAVRLTVDGREVATYASLGGKSGGETQELIAFIVGAALRFQLGDEDRARPRFAPVFLDEGFVKSDSEFAGRAVNAWKGLGFQLIVGAPLDKVTALEPDMDLILTVTKSAQGYSHVTEVRSPDPAR